MAKLIEKPRKTPRETRPITILEDTFLYASLKIQSVP